LAHPRQNVYTSLAHLRQNLFGSLAYPCQNVCSSLALAEATERIGTFLRTRVH